MESFHFGEIVILPFSYTDLQSGKRRPAVVLVDTGDEDVLVAKITTQLYESRCDLVLKDWRAAGLLAPSLARLHKLLTVEKNHVVPRAGSLSSLDAELVKALFRTMV